MRTLKPLSTSASASEWTTQAPSTNGAHRWSEVKMLPCGDVSQGHEVSFTQKSRSLEKSSYCDWMEFWFFKSPTPFWDPSHLELLASAKEPVVQQELGLGSDNTGMHSQGSCHCFETCHHTFGLPDFGGISGSLSHLPLHLTGTSAEGTAGATKFPQKKEKKIILSHPWEWGMKQRDFTSEGLPLSAIHVYFVCSVRHNTWL